MGNQFCQGCNNVCGDAKSMGESDLTKINNSPITNISNPFFFNNKTTTKITDPKLDNENNENNNNKVDSYLTSINSYLPAEEEQKKNQLYSKNNDYNENNNNNINYYNNNNNDFNNNYILNNSNELSMKGNKNENIEDKSARKITNLFRKFLEAKKQSHQNIVKEISNIPSSEYIIGLNIEQLTINLVPEETCIYLGTKFNNEKDGYGLEIFNNSNAMYFGCFRNGKRVDLGKFTISNQIVQYTYGGDVQGIYAKGFGVFSDKKKFKDYEGLWENSMKSGYGIEQYKDNSEYKGCFLNGKREGIGTLKWNDDSFYEGEWKNNKFHGVGIYRFPDGSEYTGEWNNGKFNGLGEFNNQEQKKYFGYFKNDKRSGFGFEIWFNDKKAFVGFWKKNEMNGYGKLIVKDKKKYGLWKEGKLMETINKKDFFKRLKEEKNRFINYFKLDNYRAIQNLINGENEEEE